MAITRRWAGRVFGTNTGNVYLKLEGEDEALTGVLRLNEPGIVAVYAVEGSFDPPTLSITGQPQTEIEGVEFGTFSAKGALDARGQIRGDWETSIGTGGTFYLFPHEHDDVAQEVGEANQHHSARHNFGAIQIDRDGILKIARSLRSEFPSVIVSVNTGTEQARYLEDFEQFEFGSDTASLVRIFAQKQDAAVGSQAVTIEFGPQVNWAMTQGENEAWVLGKLEALKRTIRPFERPYVTTYARWGISLNQLLLLVALILLPSFATLTDRAIFMATGVGLLLAVTWLHSKYLPFAAIYLRKKKDGFVRKLGPSMISWISGIIAGLVTTVVGVHLLGVLDLDEGEDRGGNVEVVAPPTLPPTDAP